MSQHLTRMRVIGPVITDYYYLIEAATPEQACEMLETYHRSEDDNRQKEFEVIPLVENGIGHFIVANYMPMTWGVTDPDELQRQVDAYRESLREVRG